METQANLECDVLVIGLGPTGLTAAALLGQKGHKVIAIEKHDGLYGLPRAGHVDHEIVRFLQELGVHEPFLADGFPIGSYRWYNAERKVLLDLNWGGVSVSGFNADYMMYQPVLEDCLVSGIEKAGAAVTCMRGYMAVDLTQNFEAVDVSVRRCAPDGKGGVEAAGSPVTIKAKYVIAADGARSAIREQLGIQREDLGFNETWLDIDARVKRPLAAMDPHQICDPSRPWFISPLGQRHHRFECAILPGESPADFAKADKAWALLTTLGISQDDVEIVRQQVYTFEARIARKWREGRVFLVGDAAHTMPPFMGQGLCSGMRDSANLAWKIDLILNGATEDSILDSYQIEREPHVRTWTELSIHTGEVSCTLDAVKAAERDRLLLSGEAPPLPNFPDLTNGLLQRKRPETSNLVGTTFPQRQVSYKDRVDLFDDISNRGFLILTVDETLLGRLGASESTILERLNIRVIEIAETASATQFGDADSFYLQWLKQNDAKAVFIRPDYYIYGVARNDSELGEILRDLDADLPSVVLDYTPEIRSNAG